MFAVLPEPRRFFAAAGLGLVNGRIPPRDPRSGFFGLHGVQKGLRGYTGIDRSAICAPQGGTSRALHLGQGQGLQRLGVQLEQHGAAAARTCAAISGAARRSNPRTAVDQYAGDRVGWNAGCSAASRRTASGDTKASEIGLGIEEIDLATRRRPIAPRARCHRRRRRCAPAGVTPATESGPSCADASRKKTRPTSKMRIRGTVLE